MIKNIKWNQFPRAALDALYPRRCPVCGEIVTPKGGLICPSCLLRLRLSNRRFVRNVEKKFGVKKSNIVQTV